MRHYFVIFLCYLYFFIALGANGQAPRKPNAAEILQGLKKLNVCGSVLYIAAHPDDENTNLITVLANEKLLNTTYLSLTRGDGGQNLIGNEQGDKLGIIRTQELLQARKIDGGKQLFTRARDFGFSKLPDETFSIWEKEKVLADVVLAVRYLQPDVIITRFSLEPGKTHGHHTASAMLGVEAFDIAANPLQFPEQLGELNVWQPRRIVWNSSKWFYADDAKLLERRPLMMDCGKYSPLLGKSYNEISAESRSMHKSQGFGTMGNRGSNVEYFEHLKGEKANDNILEGIDFTWNRVPGGATITPLIEKLISSYNPQDPAASISGLLALEEKMKQLPDSYWKKVKLLELHSLVKNCLGLYLEIAAAESSATPGENIKLNVEAINRAGNKVLLQRLKLEGWGCDTLMNKLLEPNKNFTFSIPAKLPTSVTNSQPYWLRSPGTVGMYDYPSVNNLYPENKSYLADIEINIDGRAFNYQIPVVYKKSDPVAGEVYKPFEIWNPIFVSLPQDLLLFSSEESQTLKVIVRAGRADSKGEVKVNCPEGWRAEPATIPYQLKAKNEEKVLLFKIFPSKKARRTNLTVIASQDGVDYQQGYSPIAHTHIPTQLLLPASKVKVVKLPLLKKGNNLGYIMGAGDEIPGCLSQVGYKVDLLTEQQVVAGDLRGYDAVIVGVRAFNTIERMKFYLPKLFQYVNDGGNLIVQYNTAGRLTVDSLAPYKLKLSNERVTVESAQLRILKPNHPLLNYPNKITDADFENWVQERGLYFPNEWSKEFDAVLSCNDPNESVKDGGLLVAKYGKGNYIYTGYSFFRELPAGVSGAYRLFANMIGLGKK